LREPLRFVGASVVTDYRLLPAGDTALSVEFGDRVDRQLSSLVLALARRLNEAKIGGVVECVPTFRSLMVYYEPLLLPFAALTERIDTLMQGLRPTQTAGRSWRLPVCYDDSLAPDLGDVAKRTNLTQAQVIERHSALTYHVYMLGFLPGQPYMGDVAHELALPRRQSPRMRIPAGSLAIAMTMTCIFPSETPCGWHLIGRCPVPLWNLRSGDSMPLLQPGDKVGFKPVSLREYEDLLAQAADGRLDIASTGEIREAAA
jgi:inhibitor of KinA